MSVESISIIEMLRCCVTAALCSQKYVLHDLLRIQEILATPQDDPAPTEARGEGVPHLNKRTSSAQMQNMYEKVAQLCAITPVEASCDLSSPIDRSLLLSAVQQRRLTQSIELNLSIESKGDMQHRSTSTTDLVTDADKLVQKVVVALLRRDLGCRYANFTVLGEEDDDDADDDSDALLTCLRAYANDIQGSLPHWDALEAHAATYWSPDDSVVIGPSSDALRRRVAVFIDPIDGTNAFVEGELQVPMTLIGIAVDGVPVAGVVNRIFQTDAQGNMLPLSLSFSISSLNSLWPCCGNGIHSSGLHFTVVDGVNVTQRRAASDNNCCRRESADSACLTATFSATTKESILRPYLDRLAPKVDNPARGAGYKLMMVVNRLTDSSSDSPDTADVFITPNDAIKKWDTCAPAAILRALGGRMSDISGHVVQYLPVFDASGNVAKKASTLLPTGFVAARDLVIFRVVSERLARPVELWS